MYSSSRFGRTLTSMRASSSKPARPQSALAVSVASSALAVPSAIVSASSSQFSVCAQRGAACCASTNSVSASYAPRAARPFGARQRLQCARNNFYKFAAPCLALRSLPRFPRRARRTPGSPARTPRPPRFPQAKTSPASPFLHRHGFQFVLQLDHHALRRLAPHAGNSLSRARSLRESPVRVLRRSSRSTFSAPESAHAGCRKQHLKKMFFPRGDKPVERQRISRTWCGRGGHFGVSSPSAAYVESGTCTNNPRPHVHEHLIRSFSARRPPKLANHRPPVLPLFLPRQRALESVRFYSEVSTAGITFCIRRRG